MITSSQTIIDGPRNVVVNLTGVCDDGLQETNVVKVRAADLNPNPGTNLKVMRVQWAVNGLGAPLLLWSADNPVPFLIAAFGGETEWDRFGGLVNGGGDTANGDILLSTSGFEAGSSYWITLEMLKS